MTIYRSVVTYSVERIAVKDLLSDTLRYSLGGHLFVEKNGDIPIRFNKSWDWIQTLKPNKVLYVLSPTDETHRLSKT